MSVTRQRLTNFSPAGRVAETRSTDFNGNVTTVTTDINRTTATAITTRTTTGIPIALLESKVAGLTVSVRGHDNLTSRTGYDSFLRPSTHTDSRNNTTTTAYHAGSTLVASITDATNTIVAQTTYDTMGRPTAQSGAPDAAVAGSPRHTTYTRYTLRGQPERQWGDAALPVSYTYDVTTGERLTLSTYRAGTGWTGATWPAATTGTADATTWTYDAPSGLLASKTDAAGASVRYTYNARSQLTRRTWARDVTTLYIYDPATAEQRDIIYSDGTPALHYTYNRLAQTTQIDDATGTHVLTHCICGKLESERFDPFFYGNRLLTYSLNANSAVGPLGRTLGFNLKTASAATEQTVSHGYHGTNSRLSTLTTDTPGLAAASTTFNYWYLPKSNLLLGYFDSEFTVAVSLGYESKRDVLTYIHFDSMLTGQSVAGYSYVTDALGQRTSVKQHGSAFADYYDSGNTSTPIFQAFAYDARGQLTAAPTYLGSAKNEGQKLQSRQHEFAYDNIGNRAWSNRVGTGKSADADTYTANALNQYLSRDNKKIPVSGTVDRYATVVVTPRATPTAAPRQGRYWSDELAVANGPLSPATVGTPWRAPLSIYYRFASSPGGQDVVRLDTRMAQIPGNPQAMTYDADGNLTNDGIWSYSWDGENRLIRLTTVAAASTGYPQITLTFRYDYLGRRVEKLVIDNASNRLLTGRRFLYDGWNLIAEYALNPQLSTLSLFRSYTWGLDITRTLTDAGGVGALLQIADHRSGKTYFPAYDGNGNITALVNSSTGAVAAAYEYSPFGEPLRADAPDAVLADQPFRFSTKYTDSETSLVYYGRRYYDPKCGRFVGRDTIEEKGGRNLYAFARNNAINVYDLLGMLPVMMAPFVVREDPIWDDGLNLQMDGGGGGRFIFDFSGGGGAGASIFVPPDFQFNLKDFKSAKCPELQELATHAELMDDSYNDDRVMGPSAPVAGTNFVRLTAADFAQYRWNTSLVSLSNSSSGFFAAVYRDTVTNQFAVAYRGTEATVSDIITDVFTQPFGISGQYSQAAAVGQQSLASFGPGVLQLGHSLGGGLAATAALATNTNAVTINPAGISYLTGLNLGLNLNNAPQLVSAWIHSGEILSGVLNPLPLIPNTNGLVSTLPAAPGSGGIVSRHRMPFVKASIWDQRVKNGCIGPD